MRTVLRKAYLDKLSELRGRTDIIKVITGMRRSGKSTLLKQYIDLLVSDGVPREDIVYINFESLSTRGIRDRDSLYAHLMDRISGGDSYVLLDEVQTVDGWEEVANSIRADSGADVYVTGSNSRLLSSELATLLTGRTYEINVLPLSFAEFAELNPCDGSRDSLESRYGDYVRLGSLPSIRADMDPSTVRELVSGTLDAILVRDILPRGGIRDFATLRSLATYMLESAGSLTNPANIAREMGASNRNTVDSCLSLLEEAFVLYRAPRYDLKGKRILKMNAKYYCTDIGMRSAIAGYDRLDAGHVLENAVFLELVRRGYEVRVGSFNGKEIDFTARKGGEIEYYQVAWSITESNEDREYGNLLEMRDAYPKTVITTDRGGFDAHEGVKTVNHIDFLMGR
jgi:predicted AAA+ superfamily ATPase